MDKVNFLMPHKKQSGSNSGVDTKQKKRLSSTKKLGNVIFRYSYKAINELNDASTACSYKGSSQSSTELALVENSSVRFGFVEIREYARLFVDHPQCQDGLGLGINWKHSPKTTRLSVDLYEKFRINHGKHTNKPLEKLCTYEKKMLLIEIGGYSEKVLWEAFATKVQQSKKKKGQVLGIRE
jgi:hypothetical protein